MEIEREAIGEEQSGPASPSVQEPRAQVQRRRGGFVVGVLLGLLTGAGLATLFTPVSGQEARRRAAEKAPELWEHREELAREAAQTLRSRLEEAIEAGREAAREAEEESRRRFERLTGRRTGN